MKAIAFLWQFGTIRPIALIAHASRLFLSGLPFFLLNGLCFQAA
nr:hypothetical protein [Alysiella crassa]